MKYALIAVIVLMSWCQASMAADKNGYYMVKGPGLMSCRNWTFERTHVKKLHHRTYEAWLDGFISAYNKLTPNIRGVEFSPSENVIEKFLDDYCKTNPNRGFFRAVEKAIEDIILKTDPILLR